MGQFVEDRCLQDAMPGAALVVPPVVVREEEYQIGPGLLGKGRQRNQEGEQGKSVSRHGE